MVVFSLNVNLMRKEAIKIILQKSSINDSINSQWIPRIIIFFPSSIKNNDFKRKVL